MNTRQKSGKNELIRYPNKENVMFKVLKDKQTQDPLIRFFQYYDFVCIYRGEKLIVTKDNRPNQPNNKSGLRKCLCWSIGLAFVVAAVTIGSLIGGELTNKLFLPLI